MKKYSEAQLRSAHKHCTFHINEIEKSELCGCFYCKTVFPSSEIKEWTDTDNPKGKTALCPNCGIDSVIGSASGFPVDDKDFLKEMHFLWFLA